MEVDGNKFRTISGQTDGKKVTSEWTTCQGKNIGRSNETTPENQAMAEAEAKRRKKLEAEYKEKIENIDIIIFKPPMLAEEFPKDEELDYPVFAQPKLDGVRCVPTHAGLYTRNGKAIPSCPHINNLLTPLFKANPGLELDGELYNHKLKDDFDTLISAIKQQKPKKEDLETSEKLVELHLYDIRDEDNPFSVRSLQLKKLVESIGSDKIVFVETKEIHSKKELDDSYDKWLEEGYEGQMVRLDTLYEFRRTEGLLKRKEMITDEFEIVEVIEGKGNRSGMAGKVVVRLHKPTTDGRDTCEANPLGGFAFYRRLWDERNQVIGKMATLKFQNYTPKGSLRFPRCITIRDYE